VVGRGQFEALRQIASSQTAAHREVVRARVLLAGADGVPNTVIAQRCGVTPVTVRLARGVRGRRVGRLGRGRARPG
jgi:hypothetical protein